MSRVKYNKNVSISVDINDFYSTNNKDDFMEVTEWTNGLGWDISINDRKYSLSYEEYDLLQYLIMSLNYHKDEENG